MNITKAAGVSHDDDYSDMQVGLADLAIFPPRRKSIQHSGPACCLAAAVSPGGGRRRTILWSIKLADTAPVGSTIPAAFVNRSPAHQAHAKAG